MVVTQPCHSNTILFSPVSRCHLNIGPFAKRTTFDHSNTRLVKFHEGGGGGGFATLLGLISYLRGSLPSCRWSLCCHWGWMWWLCIQMITVLWYIQDLFNCIESQTWCSRIYHFELSGINSKVTAIMRSQIPRNFFSPPPVNCHFQNMFCPRF